MLSDVDLKRVCGKGITIFPIIPDNIDGGSLDITASNLAWSCETGKSVVNNGKIHIPNHQNVIVISEEIICLSNKYAGTCHSRVSMVARGLGPISTPVKPGSHGRLAITLHNNSSKDLDIDIGEQIAVIMFEILKSKAQRTQESNNSTPEALSQMGIVLTSEQADELKKAASLCHKQILIKLKKTEGYKTFISLYKNTNILLIGLFIITGLLILQVVALFIPHFKDYINIFSVTIPSSALIVVELWKKYVY